ncbi:MAG: helix-turn-helix domain-containing protein [Candidatus Latescibacterota bacterium]|nr:MAG: helix-turn-helix domain-containing protein [Candidatus Latescibacterota bacterium]
MSGKTTSGKFSETVGELLKNERESKKLSLEDVNRDTRLSIDVIKMLEQDDFASFESEIYLKGFLRNYAKYLGLDAEHLLRMMEGQRGGTQAAHGTLWDIEESVREERLKSPHVFTRFILPLLIIVILILVILLTLERRKVRQLKGERRGAGQQTESIEQHPA